MRLLPAANFHGISTAWMELAARWRGQETADHAFDGIQESFFLFPVRDRFQQPLSIGVQRLPEELAGTGLFNNIGSIHDRNILADLADDKEVMGNIDQGHLESFHQFVEQIEKLRLNADVQGGGRLIGEQQGWVAG